MLRVLVLLTLGGSVGGGAVYWFTVKADHRAFGDDAASVADRVTGSGSTARAGPSMSVSESLAVFREAAATTDQAALESGIAGLAGTAASYARDLEIDALLTRLADLSPERAANLALDLRLPARFVVTVFRYWADAEADTAISAVAAIRDPAAKRAVSLALVDQLGGDRPGFERVAAVFDEFAVDRLRVEWLARRAERNPIAAFRDARSLRNPTLRRQALDRVGAAWAAQDPAGALGQAESLPADIRDIYRRGVAYEWARLDPGGFLAYLESGVGDSTDLAGGFELVAASLPEAALRFAEAAPGTEGRRLRIIAFGALAEVDPETAMARVEAMPPGQDRLFLLQSVANRYAMDDPRAALEWARNLDPPVPDVMTGIVLGIGQTDPELAVELMLDPPAGVDQRLIMSATMSILTQDADRAPELADRMLAMNGTLAQSSLAQLLGTWTSVDQQSALDWVLTNANALDASTVSRVAQQMARSDPAGAAGLVDRLPTELRDTWTVQVAGPYALYDPPGAMSWLARYQGTEVHDLALRQMITQTAQRDPRSAADMLTLASPDVQLGAVSLVAMRWAGQQPRAAVEWVDSLTDERARAAAMGVAIGPWARTDVGAARRFTLDLEAGEARDRALASLMGPLAESGDFDRALLDEFSSDRARQEALTMAIPAVWTHDPEEAEALIDLVSNANTRRQIEQRIEDMRALSD